MSAYVDANPVRAVVIGASAGAIEALSRILPSLPPNFPIPVIVVVHLPPDQPSSIVDLFAHKCKIVVKEAEDKEALECGTVYFAPPNYHVLVENDFTLSLSSDLPELFSRPSINVLFETATDVFGAELIAIVLSGANSDGANGLGMACEAGAIVVVQNPKSAEASAMPEAALKACPRAKVLSLDEISSLLAQLPNPRT